MRITTIHTRNVAGYPFIGVQWVFDRGTKMLRFSIGFWRHLIISWGDYEAVQP